jgi:hypothetical protein
MTVEVDGIKYQIHDKQVVQGIGAAEREYNRLTKVYGGACAALTPVGIVVFGYKII